MPPSGKEQLMLKVLLPLSIILALAVAFLLGRETMWQRGRPAPSLAGATAGTEPGPVVTVTSTPAGGTARSGSSSWSSQPSPIAPPTSAGGAAVPLSGSGRPSAPVLAPDPVRVTSSGTPGGHGSATSSPQTRYNPADRDLIAAYFSRVDSLMSVSTGTGSAQEVASQAINKAMQGDTSDLDQITNSTRTLQQQLSQLTSTVPEACRAYHAGLLSQLRDSQTMLEGLSTALRNNDISGLTALASLGKSSQEKTQQLQKEREAIATRYGL